MIVAWILVGVAILCMIGVVGWFIVAPPLEWVCNKIFSLSLKGHEYRAAVKAEADRAERICLNDACCTECHGTGYSGDTAVPNGMCWDCRGTGHPHAQPA